MEEHKENIQEDEVPIKWSCRQTRPSSRLKYFITYSVQYPIQDYILYNNITNDHYIFLKALSKIKEP
jgi:hypothetical protein